MKNLKKAIALCLALVLCLSMFAACGKTEGAANGHRWNAATCETAKTCSVCKKTEFVCEKLYTVKSSVCYTVTVYYKKSHNFASFLFRCLSL